MKKYAYPRFNGFDFYFFRLGGPGLSNMLFAWAKAKIDVKNTGILLIKPTFTNLYGLFNDRNYSYLTIDKNSISGIKKLYILIFKRRLVNYHDIGTVGDFSILKHHKSFLTNNLIQLLNSKKRQELLKFESEISIHLRRGDFIESNIDKVGVNERTHIKWYLELINQINKNYEDKVKISLFSDGTKEEIKELIGFPNVKLESSKNALFDILRISKSKIIITSSSSFSLWACFLQDNKNISIWNKKSYIRKVDGLNNQFFTVDTLSDQLKDKISEILH
jgi:hypothetical protein